METAIAGLIGAAMPVLVEYLKRHNIDPFFAMFCLSGLIGLGYSLYVYFVPEEIRQNAYSIMATAGFTSVSVYEFLRRIYGGR